MGYKYCILSTYETFQWRCTDGNHLLEDILYIFIDLATPDVHLCFSMGKDV